MADINIQSTTKQNYKIIREMLRRTNVWGASAQSNLRVLLQVPQILHQVLRVLLQVLRVLFQVLRVLLQFPQILHLREVFFASHKKCSKAQKVLFGEVRCGDQCTEARSEQHFL